MKKVVIIGASSGIGKQLAIGFAGKNYQVAITGRRKDLLDDLQSQWPGQMHVSAFDITDITQINEKLEQLAAKLGGIDLLVLSSGSGDINKDLDFSTEKKTIDLNVSAFTAIADWAIHFFQEQGSGHFAAISSVAGIRGSGLAPAYNATKAFQINYLEGLRQKVNKLKMPIYVSDIRPGFVDTAMAKGEGLFWVAPVEKAAKQIVSAIERKKPVTYISKRWGLIATLLKLLPRGLYAKM